MYEQMARAAVLRASASRYVACKRRLGVIEVLKPWVQALPTPAEETIEQMMRRHHAEVRSNAYFVACSLRELL